MILFKNTLRIVLACGLVIPLGAEESRSPNRPFMASAESELSAAKATQQFHLKAARVEDVRIALLGTLLAYPSRIIDFKVDERTNSFSVTDSPDQLRKIADVLTVVDRASDQTDMQVRLMEIWVRIARFYNQKQKSDKN
jgi:hypothetical protein